MIIRYEHHRTPWGPEVYAICDDIYDGGDECPLAGMGATEEEALEDLHLRLDEISCPYCKSGPGEPHWSQCEIEYADLAYRSDP